MRNSCKAIVKFRLFTVCRKNDWLIVFYAKIASWVKDGVPSQVREYTEGTARPSPSICFRRLRCLHEISPGCLSRRRLVEAGYSATCGGFPCKHLIAFLAKSSYVFSVSLHRRVFFVSFSDKP
jgi:hypothetical protein